VWRVLCSKNGDVVIGSRVAGLSVFNIYDRRANYIHLFNDGAGDNYDGFFSEMREDTKGRIWIGAMERLILWIKKIARLSFSIITPNLYGMELRILKYVRCALIEKGGYGLLLWVMELRF
jgi:hypothetical protein